VCSHQPVLSFRSFALSRYAGAPARQSSARHLHTCPRSVPSGGLAKRDPTPNDQPQDISLAAAEAQYQQSLKAVGIVMDNISPWLFEVGSWIFGGLIAFTLLVLASLLTVGPVDLSVKLSTVAFAVSLPLNVTGLVLLRLVRDLKPVQLEGITHVFQKAGLTPGQQQIPSIASLEAMRERGTRTVMRTTMGILGLSSVLTIVAITAALWHMRSLSGRPKSDLGSKKRQDKHQVTTISLAGSEPLLSWGNLAALVVSRRSSGLRAGCQEVEALLAAAPSVSLAS
jgi:hypothetical protein